MRPIHRWSLVALAVALVVLVPMTVRALPVPDAVDQRHRPPGAGSGQRRPDVVLRRRSRSTAGWGCPSPTTSPTSPTCSAATRGCGCGGAAPTSGAWTSCCATGEIDLFHHGRTTIRVGLRARRGADQRRPLDPAAPRDADLLPPALADRVLTDADPRRRHADPAPPDRRPRRARPAARAQRPADQHRPRRPLGRPGDRPRARPRRLRHGSQPVLSTAFTSCT